jgi:hypothetical protein
MKIYIAGKVTGEPTEICKAKFGKAEYTLRSSGFIVVNPMNVVNDPNCRWSIAMGLCITELAECDPIYLLSDWKESRGARIEFEVAKELDLKMFFESKL